MEAKEQVIKYMKQVNLFVFSMIGEGFLTIVMKVMA